jgi:hypothetical protein
VLTTCCCLHRALCTLCNIISVNHTFSNYCHLCLFSPPDRSVTHRARFCSAGMPATGAQASRGTTDDSPLIVIPEDSKEPHVLNIPATGVRAEAKMDFMLALSISDDEDTPDDCERGALKMCMQKLKTEKMKTKFLQIQLAKSQVLV